MHDIGLPLPDPTAPTPIPEWLMDLGIRAERLRLGLEDLAMAQEIALDEDAKPDAWWMARAVQGEMGGFDWGDQRDAVALKIAWLIESRRQKPWYGDTVREVVISRAGLKGYVRVLEPSTWALRIAQQAIDAGMNDQGPLFVLSDDDLERLGIDDPGLEYRTYEGRHGLHFYWVWPGE